MRFLFIFALTGVVLGATPKNSAPVRERPRPSTPVFGEAAITPILTLSRKRDSLEPEFAFDAKVGTQNVRLILSTASYNSWVFGRVLTKVPRRMDTKARKSLFRGNDYTLAQYAKDVAVTAEKGDFNWKGRLWMNWAKPTEGGYTGVLGAGPYSDFKMDFALVPKGDAMQLIANPNLDKLAEDVCRSNRFHALQLTSEKYWEGKGEVGTHTPREEIFRLATGSRLIQLDQAAWLAFVGNLRHVGVKTVAVADSTGELLVTECDESRDRFPIVKISIANISVNILPRDYLVQLKDGKCHISVGPRPKGAEFSLLGAPFMRNVVSAFGKDGVKLCVPKTKIVAVDSK